MVQINTRSLGAEAEAYACKWLIQQGYTIENRNVHCGFSELDIIAIKQDILYIIEVRYRRTLAYGHPFETITPIKRRRLHKGASWYLSQRRGQWISGCRVAYMALIGNFSQLTVEWLEEEMP